MKRAFLAIGLIFVAIFFGSIMMATNPLVEPAEEFLLLMSQNRISEAYELMSPDVHLTIDLDEFEEMSKLLRKYDDTSWYRRSREGNRGQLEGIIKTSEAVEMDVIVQLVKQNEEWKINYIEFR